MTRILWWLVNGLSRALTPEERDAALGDLAEAGATAGQALGDVLGLVARRQAALWCGWRPWAALAAVAVPLGMALSFDSRRIAGNSAIYVWLYADNWDWRLLGMPGFRRELVGHGASVLLALATLACWSWNCGVALGALSRRAAVVTGAVFGLMVLGSARGVAQHSGNDRVFALTFYRVVYPVMMQAALVILPAIAGMRMGAGWTALRKRARAVVWVSVAASGVLNLSFLWMRLAIRHPAMAMSPWTGRLVQLRWLFTLWPVVYLAARAVGRIWRGRSTRTAALLAALAGLAAAADPATVRAPLQPAADRKAAPEIHLHDASGKTVTLKKYRGKVVLLDFWATWCHGCKEEIPWFAGFQRKYGGKGLRVVGVSLDDDGWKAIRPFLQTADVPYRIVLGDDATAAQYGIKNMPDTFLIDRQGRIAAAYTGLVDRDDVEANLRTMLARR